MLYLSLGENCMVGKLLKRYGIQNTWSTPFTYARSNIIYAYEHDKENYCDLLNTDYITKMTGYGFDEIYRNIKYTDVSNVDFEKSLTGGLLFAHHNVIDNEAANNSYRRKIQRMLELKHNSEDVLFFYSHRYIENGNGFDTVLSLCNKFTNAYSLNKKNCHMVIFRQHLISNLEKRHLEYQIFDKCIVFDFFTTKFWAGNGEGFVSAEIDDDLFIEMFNILYELKFIDNIDFLHKYTISCKSNIYGEKKQQILIEKYSNKTIYFWCANQEGFFWTRIFVDAGIPVKGIIDNNTSKHGKLIQRVPIIPFDNNVIDNSIIFISTKNKNVAKEIEQQIKTSTNTYEISYTDNLESLCNCSFFGDKK